MTLKLIWSTEQATDFLTKALHENNMRHATESGP